MMYQQLVQDFAYRTRENLERIQELKRQGASNVYEVTALINSMLGLLVFPQQTYLNRIPTVPIAELKQYGWPIPKVTGGYAQVTNLQALLRRLRNAISHFGIKFKANEKGEISGLVVWNVDKESKENWRAELSTSDLEAISREFVALLLGESPLSKRYWVTK